MKGLKIRVPDVPAYRATPEACGANPTPIAFAEVYLALQNGTVDAQENPLTTIEAKKFYEVQKHIMLTGHIVDGLTTQVAPHVWTKLSDAEKKIFSDVALEAAARATGADQEARGRAGRRVQEEGPARSHNVNRQSFVDAVLKTKTRRVDGLRQEGLRPHRRRSSKRDARRRQHGHRCRPEGDGRRRRVPRHRRGRGPVAHAVEAWVALALFWALGATVFYQFFTRYVLNDSASWTEEIARYLLIGVVFVGAAIGVAKNNHIQVDLLYRYLPARAVPRAGARWSTCCASPSSAAMTRAARCR